MQVCNPRLICPSLLLALLPTLPAPSQAQWESRYPKLPGYSHHVYLEGYEMPTMASGPMDPAVSPHGDRVAFSARGWIWVLDLRSNTARRLTRGAEMDFRPAWSPDGGQLALVRDNDRDTRIVVVDAVSGEERYSVDSPGIELDPAFTPDGSGVIYTSAEAGSFDLWRYARSTDAKTRLTTEPGLELRAQPLPDGAGAVYLAKGGGVDRVLMRTDYGADSVELLSTSIASMARPALSPDGRSLVVSWPTQRGWELRLLDVAHPGRFVVLAHDRLALTPSWDEAGEWIYFSEADPAEVIRLYRIRSVGGTVEEVPVSTWDWQGETAVVRIRTTLSGAPGRPVPARLNVLDGLGHPAVPDRDKAHFDGQSGRVFFYTPGTIQVQVPAGQVSVSAVRGLSTPEATATVSAVPGTVTEVTLELDPVWDARASGWTSADHHFHLNYGGPYHLAPEDLVPMMRGENLDLATPLVANLHNRFESQEIWGWQSGAGDPLIRFGQEIRSHFLGHMGLIETQDLFWPWVWGPGYQVYGQDDRTNGEVLDYAHEKGGLGYYVHPVGHPDPFSEEGRSAVPVSLVVDAVLGDVDALEIVCLWSNPGGTAEVWHRFLNLGLPIAPSAGTDVMTDFYRTMAVGTTRVYAQTGSEVNWTRYLDAFEAGRTFVTNGPMLEFTIGGAGPGEVVESGAADWVLETSSAGPVETVELLVNGRVVWSDDGLDRAGTRRYQGRVDLPEGGWVAVRAHGGATRWPAMDMAPFAHTGPTWIAEVGSTDADTRVVSARELLEVLDVAEARLRAGYAGVEIPNLEARFAGARAALEAALTR